MTQSGNSHTSGIKRVLQYTYGGQTPSGIDSYLLDAHRSIDRSKLKFDYLYRYAVPYKPEVIAELEADGSAVHSLGIPEQASALRRQLIELTRIRRCLLKHRPDVIEVNMTSTFMVIASLAFSRAARVRVRIVHAHDSFPNESPIKRLLKRLATPALNALSTDRWACSKDSATYLFGERTESRGDWLLIRNAINANDFAFSSERRQAARSSLGLTDTQYCIGVVGRFMPQKNQERAVRIFKRLLETSPHAIMLLTGSGETLPMVQKLANDLAIPAKSIRFLGQRRDMPSLYNAFDVMLAPSLHEGFPIASLEAQAAGLPIVCSTAFPSESDLINKMHRLELEDSDDAWVTTLITASSYERRSGVDQIISTGHDQQSLHTSLTTAYNAALSKDML